MDYSSLKDSFHPLYVDIADRWQKMRDCYSGQDCIKKNGILYLPPTAAMNSDGMLSHEIGYQNYLSYKNRAVYHDFLGAAVSKMVGMINTKECHIILPAALEPLRLSCTLSGESLSLFLQRVHEQLLITGRCGILFDLLKSVTSAEALPYFSVYTAESIVNWDNVHSGSGHSDLSLIVLREPTYVRGDNFTWNPVMKLRILDLRNGVYHQDIYCDIEGDAGEHIVPILRGRKLSTLPFVIINSKGIDSSPTAPPLESLADNSLTIYRGEADYRQNLFMQGQDTLAIIGNTATKDGSDPASPLRIGVGHAINLPEGSDIRYVGVNSKGLPEQRLSLENDKQDANDKAARLVNNMTRSKESGDALGIRVAGQTASLRRISISAAAGLEACLKKIAIWVGADPSEVCVRANTDFASDRFDSREFLDLVTAMNMGAPISNETLHEYAFERGITSRDYKEEAELRDRDGPAKTLWGQELGGHDNRQDSE